MGSFVLDIYKNEREWENLNLSDYDTVKYLILYRSKVDSIYNSNINFNINDAGDMFEFNQELVATYASLDTIIDKCNFKSKQRRLLMLLFDGNKIHDICSMNKGYKRSATYDLFDRIIKRIVTQNNIEWKGCMTNNEII